ncbi:unnamed protein product [Bemisia tabaci]|uniref:Ionotropic receptor n=1 Tax=Bemisia tabaci TaxID=7038 RepID=A0A9P0ADB7_BEMTA|nr:unnamed protein product [Bemisia tabaci]
MCVFFYIILPLFPKLVSGEFSASVSERPLFDRREPMESVALNVCKEIVGISAQSLFYTVQLKSGPFNKHFIRQLHEASIQTILISHQSKLNEVVTNGHIKNMIFILEDIDELLSLIFDTIANVNPSGSNQVRKTRLENDEKQLAEALPLYCVMLNDCLMRSRERSCDNQVNITTEELKDGSFLSDHVFNTTRGFSGNKVWNAKNYLVFMLKSTEQNYVDRRLETQLPHHEWAKETVNTPSRVDVTDGLMFCFKLFWRFFKSQRAVICHPEGCEKYDPFLENLISNRGEAKETFFDFSWSNMHGKSIRVGGGIATVLSNGSRNLGYPYLYKLILEVNFLNHVIDIFIDSVNSTLDVDFIDSSEYNKISCYSSDDVLKLDVDIKNVETGINSDGVDYSQLDISVSIDTGAVCLVVPHSGFMSQGLVIFKCFSPWAWVFILITAVLFISSQLIFQYIQCKVFHRFYSEAELDHYKSTSSILTIYGYFICGRPPSLLLGHLFTGKVLFFIFSFSALIISTVYLSGVTTLLSERVPGTEIDSLQMLEESEIFIQTDSALFNVETIRNAFDRQNLSEALKAKVVNTLDFYTGMVLDEVTDVADLIPNYFEAYTNRSLTIKNASDSRLEKVEDNIRSIATTDAFVVHVPTFSTLRESVFMQHMLMKEEFEYHLVEECLMTYPFLISFEKNSFLFDKLNHLIARYLESGLARRFLEKNQVLKNVRFEISRLTTDGGMPRPYNLNDLQSAFISLFFGLFLSILAFIGELSIDYF